MFHIINSIFLYWHWEGLFIFHWEYFVIVFQTNLSQFGSNLFTARDSRVIGPPNDLTVSIHSPSSGQAEMKPWSRLPSSTMRGGSKDGRHRERGDQIWLNFQNLPLDMDPACFLWRNILARKSSDLWITLSPEQTGSGAEKSQHWDPALMKRDQSALVRPRPRGPSLPCDMSPALTSALIPTHHIHNKI